MFSFRRMRAASCRRLVFALLATLGLAACGRPEAQSGAGADAVPEVSVFTVAPVSLPLTDDLPGRVSPYRIAEVRARVSGIVLERVFSEGGDVPAGAVLFRLDPAPWLADLASAEAALAKAEANLHQADLLATRYESLIKANAVSRLDLDNAVAARLQARAEVNAALAGVKRARLNVDYSTVRAPIAGRVGRARVTEGALVGQDDATLLASIQQLDPVYVDFVQPVDVLQQLRAAFDEGRLQQVDAGGAGVVLLRADGSRYPLPGRLLFSDSAVDPATGTVALRAQFANPRGELLPGMFARVRFEQALAPQAIAVPQQAVRRDLGGGASVLLVTAEHTVVAQPVRTGRAHADRWIIEQGLKPGDRVVVEGVQKIAPGSVVQAIPWRDPALQPAAGHDVSKTGPRADAARSL